MFTLFALSAPLAISSYANNSMVHGSYQSTDSSAYPIFLNNSSKNTIQIDLTMNSKFSSSHETYKLKPMSKSFTSYFLKTDLIKYNDAKNKNEVISISIKTFVKKNDKMNLVSESKDNITRDYLVKIYKNLDNKKPIDSLSITFNGKDTIIDKDFISNKNA